MAFFWEAGETLEEALRRIACEQADKAICEIEDDGLSVHASVHQLRKRCKKIRGLIRLVRPAFSDYARENAYFRDLARTFSDLRDAESMQTTLDAICAHFGEELADVGHATPFAELRDWLGVRKQKLADAMQADGALEKACHALASSQKRIEDWSLDDDGLAATTAGLKRTYKRGRAGMNAAAALATPDCFHEWRKRTKFHRYHLRLLTPAWPQVLSTAREAAKDLSDWLGDDHDMAVFRQALGDNADEIGQPARHSALLALFARRAADLRSASFSLGRRVFAETPKAHADRMGTLVSAWRSDQVVPTGPIPTAEQ